MLTDTLCTRCGLCCDGTLFGDVELTGPAEATRLELLGLDVDADDADVELLALPCGALRGTTCGVYAARPRCCRTFECRLLQDTRAGVVTVDAALARIGAARAQVARVERLLSTAGPGPAIRLPLAERVADAVAELSKSSSPGNHRRRARVTSAMAGVTRMIRTTFLE